MVVATGCQPVTFQRTYLWGGGSPALAVSTATGDGYVVAGQQGVENESSVVLMKTDLLGEAVWERSFDPGPADGPSWIATTEDGGFVIAGHTGTAYLEDFLFVRTLDEVLVVKVDGNGFEEWQTVVPLEHPHLTVARVIEVPGDGYLVAGTVWFSNGYPFLVKLDADGRIAWTRSYLQRTDSAVSLSGINRAPDGSYVLVGTYATFRPGPYTERLWLLAVDPSGEPIWDRVLPQQGQYDEGRSIVILPSGSLVVLARRLPTVEPWLYQTVLMQLDPQGNLLWERVVEEELGTDPMDVAQAENGDYLIAGRIGVGPVPMPIEPWAARTDASGAAIWTRTYPTDASLQFDALFAAASATRDGGVLFSGGDAREERCPAFGTRVWCYDAILVKADASGFADPYPP